MEHRPLPHHSPAIRRYLNEPADAINLLQAANAPERAHFEYYGDHTPQLSTVQEDISRRKPSEASHFPFLCVFHFAGCDQEFASKRDWKNHVVSRHLNLDRVFWECSEGDCAHSKHLLDQCKFPQINYPSDQDGFEARLNSAGGWNSRHFVNKHDFRIHLLGHHLSTKSYSKETEIALLPNTEVQWLVDRSDSSMRMTCGLPQDLGCPMPQCASVRFTGPAAWDQRLNHAAEHFIASPQCLGVFGGEKDAELVQWATCNAVSILEQTPNARLQHDCNKSVADSGYSSRPDMPRQLNMSQHGDASPVVPRKIPEWTNDAMACYRPLENMDTLLRGIGAWVQDHEFLMPLMDDETMSSAYRPFKQICSQDESKRDHHTLEASQDSDYGDESDGTSNGDPESVVVKQWFHGWLQQWLAPLTQERPSGNEGRQGTASQSQNLASSSGSSAQKKGTSQHRRLPKRKRTNGDDDGDEESSKPQRIDRGLEIRMLACPFFKRNPLKYGHRKWKSCAYPGYESMHRLKEHIERRHSLPEYQCRRCRVDLKTSEALEAHSQQLQACTPCIVAQDGLNQDQLKRIKSKKGTRKNKSDVDRWNDVYVIAFPHDQDRPNPYLDETDQDKNAREFNLCHKLGRFLEREMPPLVGGYLSTVGCPLPETIKEDIEQYVKGLVPQLKVSFLEEMGFTMGDPSGQLDAASTTNDGYSFVESAMTRRTSEDSATTVQQDSTSEYPTTTLPKGSTSQEAMSMFPTSHGSKKFTMMPQVGYDTADSTTFQDGYFSGQDMMFPVSQMMPPYFSTTNEDWQAFLQFGHNPNLP